MRILFIHIICVFITLVSCSERKIQSLDVSNKHLKLNNGVLEFSGKPFTGVLTDTFSNGRLQSALSYSLGRKEGEEKQWFENGQLAVERFYSKGKKIGIHRAWWDNGQLKFAYHFNNKGEFHGNVKEWSRDGMLFRDFNYEKGKESGRQRLWKLNGNIKSNYEVVNGERFGLIGLKKCYTVTDGRDKIK